MMGRQPANQGKLFYCDISLERRIPAKQMLRQIKEAVSFAFVYEEVQDCYGVNGNVSVPPPAILKLMLLLFLYDVRSERELMETLPYRLDWLWRQRIQDLLIATVQNLWTLVRHVDKRAGAM